MSTNEESKKTTSALRVAATDLADNGSRLSDRIEQFERRLQALPGKMECTYTEDELNFGVAFRRAAGGWRLLFFTCEPDGNGDWSVEHKPLSSASLEEKIKSAALLFKLLKKMTVEHREHLAALASAHGALDQAEQFLEASQEGDE